MQYILCGYTANTSLESMCIRSSLLLPYCIRVTTDGMREGFDLNIHDWVYHEDLSYFTCM